MKEQNIDVFANKDGFIVIVNNDQDYGVMVSENKEASLNFTTEVKVNQTGLRLEKNPK